jgi:mono/diheme cytochrome c family protein
MGGMSKRQLAGRIAIGIVVLFGLIQLVPYGHSHANPRVSRAVKWDSQETARLFAGACQDCHSNLTHWPLYDKIAPASWLVQHDIDDGRRRLNVSTWDRPQPGIDEVVEAVREGGMPPLQYKLIHSGGRLSKPERDALISGLEATYKADPPAGR